MKILAVDIGTGTQDIYLFDSRIDIENGFKLVLPSPTLMVYRKIKNHTRQQRPILLTGVPMGGGPCQWAAEDHVKAGFSVCATPSAAYTFNDDLSAVQSMGIQIIGEEEISSLLNLGYANVKMMDFDFRLIYNTFAGFGMNLDDLSAVAVAVFDHGNAPPDISDRQFRFDYLDQRIKQENRLSAFAYFQEDIPEIMTRLKAVAISAQNIDCPLIVMDTAPAAVLGTTFDRMVNNLPVLITNIGNFHTLAFRLSEKGIDGVFEHHTGLIDRPKLEKLLYALADSSLKHEDVFEDHGHGALVYNPAPMNLPKGKSECVVTGPRRSLMTGSTMNPYYAAPFGDMMMTGCFGLIAASADLLLEYKEEINKCLYGHSGIGTPPWELNE